MFGYPLFVLNTTEYTLDNNANNVVSFDVHATKVALFELSIVYNPNLINVAFETAILAVHILIVVALNVYNDVKYIKC